MHKNLGQQRARQHGFLRSAVSGAVAFTAEFLEQRVLFSVDHLSLFSMPTSATAGQNADAIVVQILDSDGNIDTAAGAGMELSVLTGPDTSPIFLVNVNNGVATFSDVNLTTAGTYVFDANYGAGVDLTTESLTVTAAQPSQLVVLTTPSNGTAGAQLGNVTIAVEDAFGNVVTDDNATVVSISLDSPNGATLGGNFSHNTVNGVANFSDLSINKTGNFALDVTGNRTDSINLDNIQIDPVAIAPSTATHIVWGSITNQGGCITLTATIEDAFGNVVTTDNDNVTIAQTSGNGTVGGQFTVAAVDGVATFQGLAVFKPGTASFTATQGNITSGASDPFIIGTKLVFKQQLANTVAGNTISNLIVLIEDASGHVITTDNSAVTIAISAGPGGAELGGNLTIQAVNGMATFAGVSLTATGNYTLMANDGTMNTGLSKSFTIKPGAVDTLQFLQQPGPGVAASPGDVGQPLFTIVAGVAISPALSVVALDVFGNVVTTLSGKATLRANSAPDGGRLEKNLQANFVNGVATFRGATVDKSGNYNLIASFGDASVVSRSFGVRAAAASQLVFSQQPSATTAGVGTQVSVSVEDRFGNLVTSSSAQITIKTKTSPKGAAPVTVSDSAVNGNLTISGGNLTRAGNYTLIATAPGLRSAVSSSFAVTASTVAQLVFTQQPKNAKMNRTASAIRVSLQDAFGNLVTTSGVNVTLAMATSPSGSSITGNTTAATQNGVATFTGLAFPVAGNYTLVALQSVLSSAPSSLFTITH